MQTIRIFIASSSELKEDRDQFRMFISQENDRLHKKGIYIELVQWENFLDAISDSRLQDEYNKAISDCDIVLCLFFTKVGKYTAEEFDTAYQVFKDRGKPRIWTYFKDAAINTASITGEIQTMLDFKKKIGDLGHFYTQYTNIDNLINKYRTQLDKFLPEFERAVVGEDSRPDTDSSTTTADEQPHHTFNQVLTEKLIRAIQPHNSKADDFLTSNPNWVENDQLIQTAKRLIIRGYVGVVGMQLRKLMSIGQEDFTGDKMKRYLENCQITAKRALQLISYALISRLWDFRREDKITLQQTQNETLVKFFKNAAEEDIMEFLELMTAVIQLYSDHDLEVPIPEASDVQPHLKPDSPLYQACTYLNELTEVLDNHTYDPQVCLEAEKNLSLVLEHLSFLAEYRMISIRDIDYDLHRNAVEGLYLHNYTLLEGDGQAENANRGKVRRETSPVISNAVLMFKDNYRNNINMDPFIIDYNGLALTGGSKICFYTYCNTYDYNDLNYAFVEDNRKVAIKKSSNPPPDDSDAQAISVWFAKPENRKDMNFDKVYQLFHAAKKALTGIEEQTVEDIF